MWKVRVDVFVGKGAPSESSAATAEGVRFHDQKVRTLGGIDSTVCGFRLTGLYSSRLPSLNQSVCFSHSASLRPFGATGSSTGRS